jgi:hypothetical protein
MTDVLDPVELTVRKTHRGADDRAYEAEKQRKHARRERPPEVSGRCCATCPHWVSRDRDDGRGQCRVTFLSWSSRAADRIVLGFDEVRAGNLPVTGMLTTEPGFACRQWGRALDERLPPRPRPAGEIEEPGPLKALLRSRYGDR